MTATGILDHSARIEQLLIELSTSARKMSKQVQCLEEQISSQLSKLVIELDQEIDNPKKFIRFYDQEKFHQWNEDHLGKFKETLTNLSLETRRYERLIQNYHVTLLQIKEEVAHVSL